jgi:hypothetical protein
VGSGVSEQQGVAYIEEKNIRSPVDYYGRFAKRDGVWKLTAFLAGD